MLQKVWTGGCCAIINNIARQATLSVALDRLQERKQPLEQRDR
jgi:hypothetical protein